MPCEVVDTFVLEQRALEGSAGSGRWGREPEPGALRLWAARERRGLPVYRAHEALVDALACAELYLAQCAELEARSAGSSLALRHVRV
jgi:DNA polymerase-3 subunit epsilon